MSNDFLTAEERIRLKCVFLYSNQSASSNKEMTHAEIGFVLGASRGYIQQVEAIAMQKIRRHQNLYRSILEIGE